MSGGSEPPSSKSFAAGRASGCSARTVAAALAADGFGPLEPLTRHVLPMLEILQMAGEVECLSALGTSGRSSYWRLPLVSAEGRGLTNELRV